MNRLRAAAIIAAVAPLAAVAVLAAGHPATDGHGAVAGRTFSYDGRDVQWHPAAWQGERRTDGTCPALNVTIHFSTGQPDSVETIRPCGALHFLPDASTDPCAPRRWVVFTGAATRYVDTAGHTADPDPATIVASGSYRCDGTVAAAEQLGPHPCKTNPPA